MAYMSAERNSDGEVGDKGGHVGDQTGDARDTAS